MSPSGGVGVTEASLLSKTGPFFLHLTVSTHGRWESDSYLKLANIFFADQR